MPYKTTNPYTNQVVKEFPNATEREVAAALERAHCAFKEWRQTSHAHRAKILQGVADLLRSQCDELASLITLEMGKLFTEAKGEVELCANIFEYYVKNAERLLEPKRIETEAKGMKVTLVNEPLGVLLCVEPWNFPFYQIARIAAPQLSAGNTLLLKHASNVPQCAARFEKLMREAQLPEGCFRNLYVTREQLETIIKDPRVHGVALTGSEASGSAVATIAGKALKKPTMELGGADAFIVLKDADLPKAAKWGVFGRHWNAGQVCTSSKRFIVVSEVYDEYLKLFMDGVAQLKAGDPMDPTTTLAPLSSQGAAEELMKQIKKATEHGAKAIEVGEKVPTQGAFVQPTVLLNMTPENPMYYAEFFGPVSMILRAKDEEDAINIANDSPFGLGGSVFTKDIKHGEEVAQKISTGMVYVNHPTAVKADIPFGGVRKSGYGRELTDLGLMEFVNQKVVAVVDIDAPF